MARVSLLVRRRCVVQTGVGVVRSTGGTWIVSVCVVCDMCVAVALVLLWLCCCCRERRQVLCVYFSCCVMFGSSVVSGSLHHHHLGRCWWWCCCWIVRGAAALLLCWCCGGGACACVCVECVGEWCGGRACGVCNGSFYSSTFTSCMSKLVVWSYE